MGFGFGFGFSIDLVAIVLRAKGCPLFLVREEKEKIVRPESSSAKKEKGPVTPW